MKLTNKILEAVNRGIQLALDDFDDDEVQNVKSKQINHRDYTKEYLDLMKVVVDLGLPSGTLWCKYNLEAYPELDPHPFASDFYGNYYSWGETKVKNDYSLNTLTFYDNDHNLTKYCEKDGLIQLLPEDDVAYQKKKLHNFKFHIPTKEQCKELLKYTTACWSKEPIVNGKLIKDLHGVMLTSTINGNSLFFPAAGYMTGTHTENKKIDGGIWTSTNAFGHGDILDYHKAYFLHFDRDFTQPAYIDIDYRGRGLNIRPVIQINKN